MAELFPKSFLTQVAGAAMMGIIESVLEVCSPELFGQPNRVSSANPPLGMEPLMPVEKWMVLPVGGIIVALTSLKRVSRRHPKIKAFGEGVLYYTLPRALEQEIVRTAQAAGRNWAPPP